MVSRSLNILGRLLTETNQSKLFDCSDHCGELYLLPTRERFRKIMNPFFHPVVSVTLPYSFQDASAIHSPHTCVG